MEASILMLTLILIFNYTDNAALPVNSSAVKKIDQPGVTWTLSDKREFSLERVILNKNHDISAQGLPTIERESFDLMEANISSGEDQLGSFNSSSIKDEFTNINFTNLQDGIENASESFNLNSTSASLNLQELTSSTNRATALNAFEEQTKTASQEFSTFESFTESIQLTDLNPEFTDIFLDVAERNVTIEMPKLILNSSNPSKVIVEENTKFWLNKSLIHLDDSLANATNVQGEILDLAREEESVNSESNFSNISSFNLVNETELNLLNSEPKTDVLNSENKMQFLPTLNEIDSNTTKTFPTENKASAEIVDLLENDSNSTTRLTSESMANFDNVTPNDFIENLAGASELVSIKNTLPNSNVVVNELDVQTSVPMDLQEDISFEISTIATQKAKCPPPGLCIFWFLAQDTCALDSHCHGARICCKIRCSKTCIDI